MKAEMILAVDHGYARDYLHMEPGLNQMAMTKFVHGPVRMSDPKKRANALYGRLVIRQREWLESDENHLQLLPYTIIAKKSDQGLKISTYQRTKQVGEQRIAKAISIGWGGHMDANMMAWMDNNESSILDWKETLRNALIAELAQECRFIDTRTGEEVKPYQLINSVEDGGNGECEFDLIGFIYDRANEVGRVHLAIAHILVVPEYINIEARPTVDNLGNETAPEHIYLGEFPVDVFVDNKEVQDKFEPWTKILVDAIVAGKANPIENSIIRGIKAPPAPLVAHLNSPQTVGLAAPADLEDWVKRAGLDYTNSGHSAVQGESAGAVDWNPAGEAEPDPVAQLEAALSLPVKKP
jgi:predicted NUDIX family phosphoesterase